LDSVINELQKQHHAIILMIDANQTPKEYYSGFGVKRYSIEWLHLERGLDDPFVQARQTRPNSTTLTPNRDIDYVLTYGIKVLNISTLGPNYPCTSDHLGIIFDVDIASYFASSYSDIPVNL